MQTIQLMNKKRKQGTFIVCSFISNPKEHSEKKDIAEEIGIHEERYEVPRRYFRCVFICFMFEAVQFLIVLILTLLCVVFI